MRRKKVLLIDDEEMFCQMVQIGLQQQGGLEILTASHPKEGLKVASRLRPDLILLDINMPGMNGLEVLKQLKQRSETVSIPVVMLTSRSDLETKQAALQLYHHDYLEKPIPLEALRSKVFKVLQIEAVGSPSAAVAPAAAASPAAGAGARTVGAPLFYVPRARRAARLTAIVLGVVGFSFWLGWSLRSESVPPPVSSLPYDGRRAPGVPASSRAWQQQPQDSVWGMGDELLSSEKRRSLAKMVLASLQEDSQPEQPPVPGAAIQPLPEVAPVPEWDPEEIAAAARELPAAQTDEPSQETPPARAPALPTPRPVTRVSRATAPSVSSAATVSSTPLVLSRDPGIDPTLLQAAQWVTSAALFIEVASEQLARAIDIAGEERIARTFTEQDFEQMVMSKMMGRYSNELQGLQIRILRSGIEGRGVVNVKGRLLHVTSRVGVRVPMGYPEVMFHEIQVEGVPLPAAMLRELERDVNRRIMLQRRPLRFRQFELQDGAIWIDAQLR